MIRVAAGEELPFAQSDVALSGWAVEARVYAEDPLRGFLPSSGRLVRYRGPAEDATLRVDTGVYEGGDIPMFYDPMIAKVITHGPTRDAAAARMSQALDAFHIRGVSHNIGFLAALVAHPRFLEGRLSTEFIAEEYPSGFRAQDVAPDDPKRLAAVAASVHRAFQERAAMISGQIPGRERRVAEDWVVVFGGEAIAATAALVDGGYDVTVAGSAYTVRTDWKLGQPLFRGTINEDAVCYQVERVDVGYRITHRGAEAEVLVLAPRVAELQALMPAKVPPDTSRFLLSPMPGLLVSLAVSVGDAVKAGDELAVVEAMKMENVLRAGRDATVKEVKAGPGDSLAVDQVILEFE